MVCDAISSARAFTLTMSLSKWLRRLDESDTSRTNVSISFKMFFYIFFNICLSPPNIIQGYCQIILARENWQKAKIGGGEG